MRAILILALALASVPTTAAAEGYTGNDLLEHCRDFTRSGADKVASSLDKGFCLGFVTGTADAYSVIRNMLADRGARMCLPPTGVSEDQLVRVVVKYLEEHPEKLHEPAVMHIMNALLKAFPCEPETKPTD